MPPKKYKKLLIRPMQRKAFSFYRFRPQPPLEAQPQSPIIISVISLGCMDKNQFKTMDHIKRHTGPLPVTCSIKYRNI